MTQDSNYRCRGGKKERSDAEHPLYSPVHPLIITMCSRNGAPDERLHILGVLFTRCEARNKSEKPTFNTLLKPYY